MNHCRNNALLASLVVLSLCCGPTLAAAEDLHLGSGVKAGEITDGRAIVHVRLTAAPEQDEQGLIPGRQGQARLCYGLNATLEDAETTAWQLASADEDYSIQFQLENLQPDRRYHYRVEYRSDDQADASRSEPYSFRTAPVADVRAAVRFQVTTGQDVRGKEQLEWLKRSILASGADWRIVISPTPIIGPDRVTKTDNHANPNGFWTEGQAFLDWIKDNQLDNVMLACGDRHWQYHVTDQRNDRQIHEFSCEPTCDEHTQTVPPIEGPFIGIERPHSASQGGFLTVTYQATGTIVFEFFDEVGQSLYQREFQR